MGAYLVSGYALTMLINAVFPHLLATLFMRRYTLGPPTALALNIPITSMLLYQWIEEGFIDKSAFIY